MPQLPRDGVYQLEDCDKVCLLPRLSLSELIHISGLVRTICERSTDVMLLAKRDHVRPLRNLYADIPHVRFKFVDSWDELVAVRDDSAPLLQQIEDLGYRLVPLPSFREACPYAMLGLEVSLAKTNFRLQRNLDDERALLDRVRAEVGATYVVLHDDDTRRIRQLLIPDGLPVVRVRDPRWRTHNVFDWIQVIDHAVQLHAIDSCFLLLADLLDLKARKFCHSYCDPTSSSRPGAYHDVIVVWG